MSATQMPRYIEFITNETADDANLLTQRQPYSVSYVFLSLPVPPFTLCSFVLLEKVSKVARLLLLLSISAADWLRYGKNWKLMKEGRTHAGALLGQRFSMPHTLL